MIVILGVSQSANIFGDDGEKLALVGTWIVKDGKIPVSVDGVAHSSDKGQTWTISSPITTADARYGAFPTESTWYVASGMWGNDPAPAAGLHRLTKRLTVTSTGVVNIDEKVAAHVKSVNSTSSTGETGWFGAVSKTTDGGKTWTQVLTTDLENDYIYFNGISCASDNHCTVVGEGDEATGGYLNVAYTTFDGGVTWEKVFTANDVGLMQVKLISETEGWMAGMAKKGPKIMGQFYRTTDGGKSFVLEQVGHLFMCE